MTSIKISPITYDLVSSPAEFTAPNQVLKGETIVEDFQNIAAAAMHAAGEGAIYSEGTAAHPIVNVSSNAARLNITAKNNGSAGNGIELNKLTSALKVTQMSGGVDGATASTILTFTGSPFDHKIFIGDETTRLSSVVVANDSAQIGVSTMHTMQNIAQFNNDFGNLATAGVDSATQVTFYANDLSQANNDITVSVQSDVLSFSHATFTGGVAGVKGTAFIQLLQNLEFLDAITITDLLGNPITYVCEFEAVSPYEFLRGATKQDTAYNLWACITAGPGEGTLYGTGTAAHPDVTATASGDIISLQAREYGPTEMIGLSFENLENPGVPLETINVNTNNLSGYVIPVAATATLTASANPKETKITLGGKTMRFTENLQQANDVQLYQDNTAGNAFALQIALDASGVAGVDYGVGTTSNANATVTDLQEPGGGVVLLYISERTEGAPGNNTVTHADSTVASFPAATMSGGATAAAATGSFYASIDSVGEQRGLIPAAPRSARAPVIL